MILACRDIERVHPCDSEESARGSIAIETLLDLLVPRKGLDTGLLLALDEGLAEVLDLLDIFAGRFQPDMGEDEQGREGSSEGLVDETEGC